MNNRRNERICILINSLDVWKQEAVQFAVTRRSIAEVKAVPHSLPAGI